MQRITRSQSILAIAETNTTANNRAIGALTQPQAGALNGTETASVPLVKKRKQSDISDAVSGLNDAPASKIRKTDLQSNEPQFKSATEKENEQPTPAPISQVEIDRILQSHDVDVLRLFLRSATSTPRAVVQLLHGTVDRGWLEGFDVLVQNGALTQSQKADLVYSQNGHSTLFQKTVLSQNSKILKRLNALECPTYKRSRVELKGAIALAAYAGNAEILHHLCGAADVESGRWSSAEMSYFFKAAVLGTRTKSGSFVQGEAAIEYLRSRYPDSVVRCSYDNAVLTAVKLNNWDAASSLLGIYGANPDARGPDKQTALMHAAKNGLLDVYELLRFHDASPHKKDADGKSVLHHAVEGGNERIVSDLVGKCKVDTKVSDARNQTASGLAGMLGRSAINDLITWGVHQPFDSTDY
jgi:hypothetical protein